MDFLLQEDTIVMDITDDDTLKQSEGLKEGVIELPREPKEEPVDTATENVFGVHQKAGREGTPSSPIFLLARGYLVEGSAPVPPAALAVYVPGWGITQESHLS